MPPLPSPGRVVKAEYTYSNEDADAMMVLYFNYGGSGSPSATDLSTLHGHIQADLAAPFIGASSASTNGVSAKYTDLSSPTGATYETTWTWTGTNTGGTLSSQVAVVVQHLIARRYRGGHPRTYMMCGLGGDFETSSIKFWQAAFLANIQAGWAAFLALFPYNAPFATWTWCNVSFYETVGGVRTVRATPLVDLVTGVDAKQRVCTQRRRLGRVNA